MNPLTQLVAALRQGAQQLRSEAVRSPGKASLYQRWATHLEDDAKSLLLLAKLAGEADEWADAE